jgi:hypothetical protein
MSCKQVTTLSDATIKIPSSVLPINGLRRDSDGSLTKDAMTMIIDGLKSRGIDPTDKAANEGLRKDLATFLCSLNNQYQFLLKELIEKVQGNMRVETEFIDTIKDKNITMQDVLNTSGYLGGINTRLSDSDFIEGWQNTVTTTNTRSRTIEGLQNDMTILDSKSYLELKKHIIEVTQEKNKVASNYLGLYGFLNLVAVGLLIYVAASSNK